MTDTAMTPTAPKSIVYEVMVAVVVVCVAVAAAMWYFSGASPGFSLRATAGSYFFTISESYPSKSDCTAAGEKAIDRYLALGVHPLEIKVTCSRDMPPMPKRPKIEYR